MSLTSRVRVAVAACLLAACSGVEIPDDIAGVYRLETVNGAHVPAGVGASEFGFSNDIERGDLLLLPEGRFELQVAAGFPADIIGTATASGHAVTLSWKNPGDTTTFSASGSLSGDALTITIGTPGSAQTLVFRRFARRAPVIGDGTYVMSDINGHGLPAAYGDNTNNGVRFVGRVVYDTVLLRDGLFFTRSREVTATSYQPTGDSAMSLTSFRTFGTFTSVGSRLVLSDGYRPNLGAGAVDTFVTTSAGFNAVVVLPQAYTATYLRR